MTNNKHNTYANNAIMTASKEELTLMLYNGAIKFCNKAIHAISLSDFEGANEFIIRVEDIIEEFQLTLNKDYEIANSLDLLYDYMMRQLVQANISKDIDTIQEVAGYLRELRDVWKEAMVLSKTQKKSS